MFAYASLIPSQRTPTPVGYIMPVPFNEKNGKTGKLSKVCIVGGGPSGLTAALRLHDKGYKNVIIFEKEDAIGGRTQNWIDPDGGVQNKGAIAFLRPFYEQTRELMNRFGISGTEWPTPSVNYFYNKDARFVIDQKSLPQPNRDEVEAQIAKYALLYQGWATEIVPGFPNGVPQDLSVPMLTLLTQHQLLLLTPFFHAIIVASGYGSLETTPAIFVIQVMHPGLLVAWATGQSALERVDYEALFRRVAEGSEADIRLKAEITNVEYGPKNVRVKYNLDGDSQTQKCDYLIHAIPYGSKSDITSFGFGQHQMDVLSQLVYEPYWTAFAKISEVEFRERYYPVLFPSATGLMYHEFEGVGEPVGIFKQFPTTSYASLYSWHKPPLPEGFSGTEVSAQIGKYLGWIGLNKDENGTNIPIEIEAVFEWTYFPHVNTDAIDSGWFQELEDLQGYRGTYYTGGYRTMDTIESVVRSANDIVDRFF